MNTKKLALCIGAVLALTNQIAGEPRAEDSLVIFEGTVVKIAPMPKAGCGVLAIYQLVRYRVDRVYRGKYQTEFIVVDHPNCEKKDLNSLLSIGDKVIIVPTKQRYISDRWNAEGIRSPNESVHAFYLPIRFGKLVSCCVLPSRA